MVSHLYVTLYAYIVFNSYKLDAGTFGTMGVGCGFAISAAFVNEAAPITSRSERSPIFCIQGDSAFGFSGMEVETACRLVHMDVMWLSCDLGLGINYQLYLSLWTTVVSIKELMLSHGKEY